MGERPTGRGDIVLLEAWFSFLRFWLDSGGRDESVDVCAIVLCSFALQSLQLDCVITHNFLSFSHLQLDLHSATRVYLNFRSKEVIIRTTTSCTRNK
jgi:hypothetical protein